MIVWIEPNFQTVYMCIHTTYPANIIEATDKVQLIQFK